MDSASARRILQHRIQKSDGLEQCIELASWIYSRVFYFALPASEKTDELRMIYDHVGSRSAWAMAPKVLRYMAETIEEIIYSNPDGDDDDNNNSNINNNTPRHKYYRRRKSWGPKRNGKYISSSVRASSSILPPCTAHSCPPHGSAKARQKCWLCCTADGDGEKEISPTS